MAAMSADLDQSVAKGRTTRALADALLGRVETATEAASVVGPLCTPLDLLADRMLLPVAEPVAAGTSAPPRLTLPGDR